MFIFLGTDSFIHLFNKYLSSAYYGQGPAFGRIDERPIFERSYLVFPERQMRQPQEKLPTTIPFKGMKEMWTL